MDYKKLILSKIIYNKIITYKFIDLRNNTKLELII